MIPITGSFRFVRVAGATFINVLNLLYRQYHATAVGVRHDRYLVKGGNDQGDHIDEDFSAPPFLLTEAQLGTSHAQQACLL